MTAHKHILDYEKKSTVWAITFSLPFLVICRYLSDSYVFIHFSFCIRMENNMHRSRHRGLLYERADVLQEWWPACCQRSFFSLRLREMRAIQRVHRFDSWLTCHGNTVLSYCTNGPRLPKANIKHTERKQCVDSGQHRCVGSTNTIVTLTSTLVQLFAILMEVRSIEILSLWDSSKSKCKCVLCVGVCVWLAHFAHSGSFKILFFLFKGTVHTKINI